MDTDTRNMGDFIEEHGITAEAERAESNPNMDEGRHPMKHWRVTLRREGAEPFIVPFSQGSAYKDPPAAVEVIDCLASDAAGADPDNARTFEEWADSYGYDTDSRRAERTYRAILRQSEQLRTFLGAEAYDALLWHTERI